VQDEHDHGQAAARTSVERLLERSMVDETGIGKPLSRRARQSSRTLEDYLKAGVRPRWMERVAEIDRGIMREKQRLGRAYRSLHAQCGSDRETFARRWLAIARAQRFDSLNELIDLHNEWYPVERRLPMDPRTGDYVPIHGRSYRRPVLGPEWVLEHFPARPQPER
jgi:hypothetical protein